MAVQFSGNPKPFGVIGLVLAIFSFLFSLIPCVGFYAITPGFISVVFCVISFLYLKQEKESTVVPLSGLIIGTLTIAIGIFQYVEYEEVFDAKTELENVVNEVGDEFMNRVEQEILEGIKEGIEKELENDSIQKERDDTVL